MLGRNFCIGGLTGWCMEIIFTSAHSIFARDKRLIGQTSIWMFPIYGCAAVILPVYQKIASIPICVRGLFYTAGIFFTELTTGLILKHFHICPWDYSSTPFHYKGVIRLDYTPVWFFTGLLFEKILKKCS